MTLKFNPLLFTALFTLMLSGCGGGSRAFEKQPIDDLIKQYGSSPEYSIILYDMDYDEGKDAYTHQYQVVYAPVEDPDTLMNATTAWLKVSDEYFDKNVDNMGMTLVSKKDGKVSKIPSPPGYNHVGDKRYGEWRTGNNGGSFWAFYGQYMFMSQMFRMGSYPVRRSYYDDYSRNYRGSRPYYGSGGSTTYGTKSSYNQSRNSSSSWNKKSSDFKQRVRSKVNRSATKSRTTRTSSRSRSSARSRGGGFGK